MNPYNPNRRRRAEAAGPRANVSDYVRTCPASSDAGSAASAAGPRRRRPPAFTMLELVISLSVLGIGLLGIQALMIRQSRQVTRMEQWCLNDRTYYVVHQSEKWMRALRGPATLESQPGQSAWSPPVVERNFWDVSLGSFTCPYGTDEASAQVTLTLAD